MKRTILILTTGLLQSLAAPAQQPALYPFTTIRPAAPVEAERVVIRGDTARRYALVVLDVLGKIVLQKQLDAPRYDLSSCQFKKGFYTYKVMDDRKKVLKQGSFEVGQ